MNRSATVLLSLLFFTSSLTLCQPSLGTLPDGSPMKGSEGGVVYSDDALWVGRDLGWRKHWTPPPGTTITTVTRKFLPGGGGAPTYSIILSDGSIFKMTHENVLLLEYWTIPELSGKNSSNSSDTSPIARFLHDDMYILRYYVWVSRDDGTTWTIDTAGLSNATVVDLALDTAGNVYAATNFGNKGLFWQGRTDSVWQNIGSLGKINLVAVFIDRLNRIYAGSSSRKVYYSADNGSTWDSLTTNVGSGQIMSFNDDAFGNIYAITDNGRRLYKSAGGNQDWVRIDEGIRNQAVDTTVLPLFNKISGDSILYLATAFGLFTSTNNGTSWSHVVEEFVTSRLNGFTRLPSGRILAGTDLGTYYRNEGSASWTKAFPSSGFLRMGNFQRDNAGNLFCVGGGKIYKSTNDGSTWNEDNAGLAAFGAGTFYIDETGVQHYIVNGSFSTSPRVYVRNGDSWVSDMSGINLTVVDKALAIQSDQLGNLFVSIQLAPVRVLRRPIAGGTWTADTTGLGSKQLGALIRYTNGDILGLSGKIYRHTGGTWVPLNSPAPVASNTAYAVSVDSNGAIYAAFSGFVSFQTQWKGVYVSKDTGATWHYAGLDSIEIKSMVSYGDTTYALTTRGIFFLSTTVSTPTLSSPANSAANIPMDTILSWEPALGATSYQLQISTGNTFASTVFDQSGITTDSLLIDSLAANTTYYWRVKATGPGGTSDWSEVWNFTTKNLTGVEETEVLPKEYSLAQNYPNPFNPVTVIGFTLKVSGFMSLKVYDILGREVAVLVNEERKAGTHSVRFHAAGFSTGVYIYRLRAGGFTASKKLSLMK